jgi:2-(1,2-epoxy-1,2-dihydrophenyl)acetyl-CoA isomerase
MADETVLVERVGGVTRVTLNRPDRLNAFTLDMHAELRAAFSQIESDEACRAVVMTGAGRGFCAGQDLAARKAKPGDLPPDLGASLDANYNPLIRRMRALPKPIVTAVNGVAAGAGANLALNGDIVLAARSARFIQSFSKLGLIPDAGGTWLLPRLMGEARAKAAVMLAEPIAAEQAEAWGLIWKVIDDDKLADEAMRLATHLAAGPTQGFAAQKAAIQAAAVNGYNAQLDLERDTQRMLGLTADYQEGVTAFLEKRPARFTGKKAGG